MTKWLCLSASGDVLGACVADDVGEARVTLRETLAKHPGAFVQSHVSFACGYTPKAVAHRQTKRQAQVAAANRALRARKREASDMGLQSGASRQSSTQARIWNGIVNRQAKRQAKRVNQGGTQ